MVVLKAVVKSHSLELIQACNGETEILGPYSALLADCFSKAGMMEEISFAHCPREANKVAHELAKFAYESKRSSSWKEVPPDLDFILPFVI